MAGSLAALHERDLAARMEEIDALMPLASPSEKDELTAEKMQLRDELQALGGRTLETIPVAARIRAIMHS